MAALSLCEGLHDLQDQIKTLQELDRRTNYIETESKNLADHVETFKVKETYRNMHIFSYFPLTTLYYNQTIFKLCFQLLQDEIYKKISDVLARTPLDLYRKAVLTEATEQMIEPIMTDAANRSVAITNIQDVFDFCSDDKTAALMESIGNLPSANSTSTGHTSGLMTLRPPDSLHNLAVALNNPPIETLKTVGSGDLLSPSPIFGFGSFDTQSLDELATPDEYGSEQFLHGLTNVNYDIDLSDLSTDNSAAEDAPVPTEVFKPKQDPFSPDGLLKSSTIDPWKAISTEPFNQNLPIQLQNETASTSILDANDSPTTDCLLPSPIKPLTANQQSDFQ